MSISYQVLKLPTLLRNKLLFICLAQKEINCNVAEEIKYIPFEEKQL
jgi:hypothetical protein